MTALLRFEGAIQRLGRSGVRARRVTMPVASASRRTRGIGRGVAALAEMLAAAPQRRHALAESTVAAADSRPSQAASRRALAGPSWVWP